MLGGDVLAEGTLVVAGILATCLVATVATLVVRGRRPGRRAALAIVAVAVVAWLPLPDHWDDGCNRHTGWVPLWTVPVASPLQRAGLSVSATDTQTMVLCGTPRAAAPRHRIELSAAWVALPR